MSVAWKKTLAERRIFVGWFELFHQLQLLCSWGNGLNVPVNNQIYISIGKIGVGHADEGDAREQF